MREGRAEAVAGAEADGEADGDGDGDGDGGEAGRRLRGAPVVRELPGRARLLRPTAPGRLEGRVARPSSRAAVSAKSQRSAIASGGKVNPDTSASTSWLAFSDQFHKR